MSYAAQADLVDRFGDTELRQITDTAGTGQIDAAATERALGDANSEINAALAGRYALPLPHVPLLLTRIACDLARESLYTDSVTDTVKDRAAIARKLLKSIATGESNLELPAAPAASSVQGLVEYVSGRRKSPFGC